jgi:hypothetical protein
MVGWISQVACDGLKKLGLSSRPDFSLTDIGHLRESKGTRMLGVFGGISAFILTSRSSDV